VGYSLLVVVTAIALLEVIYAQWPVPPGVDSGDWIQRSFAWVGLAHPPEDAVGSPYLYNPLMFPLLGVTELVAGNPLTTGFVFGGMLLGAFGLSVIHVSRRFLLSGPYQVLFVGFAVLNGTTLSILFWGGYPNFLAFVFFNEALVFLLAFVRSRSTLDGLLLYLMACLVYLTHDLTFVILLATLVTVAVFLVARDRRWLGLFLSRANLVGLVLLGVTVLGYTEISKYLAISPPGYLSSNPAAFLIDNVGEVFRPFASAPMLLPMGAAVVVTPLVALAALGGICGAITILLAVASKYRPDIVDHRHFLAAGALVAACAVPAGGYLAHVDTDYTRFAYYLPLPVALLGVLTLETIVERRWARSENSAERGSTSDLVESRPQSQLDRRRVSRESIFTGAVVLVLAILVANVSAPVALWNEKSDAGTDHDTQFLQAIQWLNLNPQSGSVMTTQGAVRWVEALTDRGAFDVGPTWLLFENWQILNAETTYWAFTSEYALTNNRQVLSFSGFNTSTLEQAPMYSAYVQGVQFPLLRIIDNSIYANVSTRGAWNWIPAEGVSPARLQVSDSPIPSGSITYSTSSYSVLETGIVRPPGSTWVNFTVTPNPGSEVAALRFSLGTPPTGVSLLHAPSSTGVGLMDHNHTLDWNTSGTLGQLPGSYPVDTQITMPLAPASSSISNSSRPNNAVLTFANPDPSAPFTISLSFSTPDSSNPAVTLPPLMVGTDFFLQHDIHFLLVPNQAGFAPTVTYFEAEYGFQVTLETGTLKSSEWTGLQR